MVTRLALHNELIELLGSNNVYFQPPSSKKMEYPCIRYSLESIQNKYANNDIYSKKRAYKVLVIDQNPDSLIADRVSELPYCSFNSQYSSDNLNHFAFTLYW